MAGDNVTLQSAAPATPPAPTKIATIEADWSGETVQAGIGGLVKSTGAEGARVLTLINPATEDKQDDIIAALVALIASTKPNTATLSNTAGDASSVTILADNLLRLGAILVNDSAASCYVKFGTTASATDFTKKLAPGEAWDLTPTGYTGRIDAIWTAATGAMRATELTA